MPEDSKGPHRLRGWWEEARESPLRKIIPGLSGFVPGRQKGRCEMMKTLSPNYSPQAKARKTAGAAKASASTKENQAPAMASLSPSRQATLNQLLTSKCDFVHNQVFEDPQAQQKVFDEAPEIRRPDTSWYHPVMDKLTPDMRNLNTSTLILTAEEERALFLQFNYCRYRVHQMREEIGEGQPTLEQARDILYWHDKAEAFRDQIAQTNLALVLAMAKRTRMSEMDFSDLVSEGNMALLRAVDKFDAARGFKFSTYACRAILKAFSRSGMKLSKYRQLFPTDFDPKFEKSDYMDKKRAAHEDDCVDELKEIFRDNTAELTDIEKEVIEHRFAIGDKQKADPDASPLTLEQVGKIIGVTKERVRQIQNKALEKLRNSLENGYLS
jgi:RNA polymerase primary sigma factor